MKHILATLNVLLAVIAVCLILIVAELYFEVPATAHAQQTSQPQSVQLVFWNGVFWEPVLGKTNTINAHLVYWDGTKMVALASRDGPVKTTK